MYKTYEHIHQPQIDFQQSLQHFSINPLCNTSLQDLSATRLSLQHFSTTLLCDTSLQHSSQHFSATHLYNTFRNTSLLLVATLLYGNSLQLHHYHKTHDHKTTTKKTPLLQNTTQHSHDTAQHQYNATCFRHNKSTPLAHCQILQHHSGCVSHSSTLSTLSTFHWNPNTLRPFV